MPARAFPVPPLTRACQEREIAALAAQVTALRDDRRADTTHAHQEARHKLGKLAGARPGSRRTQDPPDSDSDEDAGAAVGAKRKLVPGAEGKSRADAKARDSKADSKAGPAAKSSKPAAIDLTSSDDEEPPLADNAPRVKLVARHILTLEHVQRHYKLHQTRNKDLESAIADQLCGCTPRKQYTFASRNFMQLLAYNEGPLLGLRTAKYVGSSSYPGFTLDLEYYLQFHLCALRLFAKLRVAYDELARDEDMDDIETKSRVENDFVHRLTERHDIADNLARRIKNVVAVNPDSGINLPMLRDALAKYWHEAKIAPPYDLRQLQLPRTMTGLAHALVDIGVAGGSAGSP